MFERLKTAARVYRLPLRLIDPSPYQARQEFDPAALHGLAQSIRENGLLQPISVRPLPGGRYELIAGERRLRACRMVRLDPIPAIVYDFEDAQAAALSLLENLQRADLNLFEQAEGLREVLGLWGCTQSEAALRLGMSQPTLANKLRLLQLSREQRRFVLETGLTERHARAVLRLPPARRSEALGHIVRCRLNVREADRYIDSLLRPAAPPKARRRPPVRDLRLAANTIDNAVRLMTEHGIAATARRQEGEGYIEYIVRIPTKTG